MHESGGSGVHPGRTSVVSKVATGLGMAGLDEEVVTARALRSDRRPSESTGKKRPKSAPSTKEIMARRATRALESSVVTRKRPQTEDARDGRFRLVLRATRERDAARRDRRPRGTAGCGHRLASRDDPDPASDGGSKRKRKSVACSRVPGAGGGRAALGTRAVFPAGPPRARGRRRAPARGRARDASLERAGVRRPDGTARRPDRVESQPVSRFAFLVMYLVRSR